MTSYIANTHMCDVRYGAPDSQGRNGIRNSNISNKIMLTSCRLLIKQELIGDLSMVSRRRLSSCQRWSCLAQGGQRSIRHLVPVVRDSTNQNHVSLAKAHEMPKQSIRTMFLTDLQGNNRSLPRLIWTIDLCLVKTLLFCS